MKKLIFLFVLIFVATACAIEPTTTFKNPIFSLPMQSEKITTQLYPNKIKYTTNDDPTTKCLLQEDNTTNLLYKCAYPLDNSKDIFIYYHRFISVGKGKKNKSCIILHNQSKTSEGTYTEGTSVNFVYKENCGPTESIINSKSKYIEEHFK